MKGINAPPAKIAAALSPNDKCRPAAMPANKVIDPKKEREFFLKKGAVVSASIAERERIPSSGNSTFYADGRPTGLCRISNCFSKHAQEKNLFLCSRHYNMIEVAIGDGSVMMHSASQINIIDKEGTSNEAKAGEGRGNNSNPTPVGVSSPSTIELETAAVVEEATKMPSENKAVVRSIISCFD